MKSSILIREKDFLSCVGMMERSLLRPQAIWFDITLRSYRKGKVPFTSLYRSMERSVVGGCSTFKSMEELAIATERDCWYLHNYGDANWWKKENENNENKIYNTLSGRQH